MNDKSIMSLMQDTKWDFIRTTRIQKLLVALGVASIILAPIAYWFEDSVFTGFGAIFSVLIFVMWWLLQISVRSVADVPDAYLDEYQVMQRDRTYLYSYRILASVTLTLVVLLMMFVISQDYSTQGGADYYNISMTFAQVNALMWFVLGPAIITPNLVLAWKQAKKAVR